jgi:hypothetical protein
MSVWPPSIPVRSDFPHGFSHLNMLVVPTLDTRFSGRIDTRKL